MPFQARWHAIRWRMQIAIYRWYCRARGRQWEYPTISGGTGFRVTKSIPGVRISLFGRGLWLIVPMVVEREKSGTSHDAHR